jgi:microcystin-dependent protein
MLFAAIGTRHGGDVNNFNIPDYRGRFLRGTDGGVGRDPDRASRSAMNAGGNTGDNVGSIQGDQFRTHNHAVGQNLQRFDNGGPWDDWSQIVTVGQQNIVTVSTGGSETRPINANVIFCIKI